MNDERHKQAHEPTETRAPGLFPQPIRRAARAQLPAASRLRGVLLCAGLGASLAALPACGPRYTYKLDYRKPQEMCQPLARENRPQDERARAIAYLRDYLGVRVQFRALTPDEIQRALGTPPAPGAAYGQQSLVLATRVEALRDDIAVDVEGVEKSALALGGAWDAPRTQDARYSFFGLHLNSGGIVAEKPFRHLPWPKNPLDCCQVRESSGWSGIGRLFTIFAHAATLGVFWWGPRLANGTLGGSGGSGGSYTPPPDSEQARILAEQAKGDAWALQPGNRALQRLRTTTPCTARPGSPCTRYTLLERRSATETQDDTLRVSLRYRFPLTQFCDLQDELYLRIPPGESLPARLLALTPEPRLASALDPPPPLPPGSKPLPPQPAPPPPAQPLTDVPSVHVLSRADLEDLTHLPIVPEPDALLYSCRLRSQRCSLRIETHDATWEHTDEIGDLKRLSEPQPVVDMLLYEDLRWQRLLDTTLDKLLSARLYELTAESEAPLSILKRRADFQTPREERVVVSLQQQGRLLQLSRPLPPGTGLADRVARALTPPGAGAAVPHRQPGLAARDVFVAACADEASPACSALQQNKWNPLQSACLFGAGAACRLLAGPTGNEPLLRKGCLLGDALACALFARRGSAQASLSYKAQNVYGAAYGMACEAGVAWACNDAAVLIGRLAVHDTADFSTPSARPAMRGLLEAACKQGDALACKNNEKLAAPESPLDQLQLSGPN